MNQHHMAIGLALSGGGVRASVFHMGVLARLATDRLLENVTFISTVSGGTLVVGLIYARSGYRWPTSARFLDHVAKEVRTCLTTTDLQSDIIWRSLTQPRYLLRDRGKVIGRGMQTLWGISGSLKDIPLEPRWVLNATAYETGRNFRFIPQRRMGDYKLGYVKTPNIALVDAMTASAGFPGLIGPLILNTHDYQWFKYEGQQEVPIEPPFRKLHLWDGGLYDNLGVEPLFKVAGGKYRDEINFLIVSDASPGLALAQRSRNPLFRAYRLIEIVMEQVRGLRARTIVDQLSREVNRGVYLKMGNTVPTILTKSGVPDEVISRTTQTCLDDPQVRTAVQFATTLRRLSEKEYDLLFQHGWEVADATLRSRCPTLFDHAVYV